jgi:hypothetical protein
MQLSLNLSNGVIDTLESSLVMIYLETPKKYLYMVEWLDAVLD